MSGAVRKRPGRGNWKWIGFYASIIAIPVVNFCVFTLGGLATTVGLGFFGYRIKSDTVYWNNFANFRSVFAALSGEDILGTFKISLVWYLLGWVCMIAGWVISFYCYKKFMGGGVFRTIFFLPSIIPGIVWITLFKNLANDKSLSALFGLKYGLLAFPESSFFALMFYTLWMGMCAGVLTGVGFLGSISPELTDAARIDGCGLFGEAVHVAIPAIWPFVSVGIITGVVGLFMSGPPLYEFYAEGADKSLWSFNYYLFCMVMKDPTNKPNQMYSAAASLMVTAVAVPLTFFVKWLLTRFGPQED